MFLKIHSRKTLVVTSVLGCLFVCLAAIYCLPFIDIQPQIPKRLPQIRYDFSRPPLLATSPKQYKIDKLFSGQIHGAESIEADSFGNLYMAIEGGFILYAQMNYTTATGAKMPKLWLLAELNHKQANKDIVTPSTMQNINNNNNNLQSVDNNNNKDNRACKLDEVIYGSKLSVGGRHEHSVPFSSKVAVSRCSKPLGIRLSHNQNYLYVIDTLKGLYQIDLKQAHANLERLTTIEPTLANNGPKLILDQSTASDSVAKILLDFNIKWKKQVPLERMADNDLSRVMTQQVPVAMTAMDDLAIDEGAGTNGADVIYMTDASQLWPAISYLFDFMEARPTGLVLRYDTGSNHLSALDNIHLTRVRMSTVIRDGSFQSRASSSSIVDYHIVNDGLNNGTLLGDDNGGNTLKIVHSRGSPQQDELKKQQVDIDYHINSGQTTSSSSASMEAPAALIEVRSDNDRNAFSSDLGYGAPRFDSNDIYDDRPLFFPNGIELMDDRQALLIADTSNKRIIKHFIRGPRRGQSDLWTWTPHHPDNIRRGRNSFNRETYWVAGCGKDRSSNSFLEGLVSEDTFNNWPRVRVFLLKNIYFVGWLMETVGATRPFRSQYIRDLGYSLKMGLSLMDSLCDGVMILQYNRNGRIIKAIHGKDFPSDMKLLSQITEVQDAVNPDRHSLYLASPLYNYVYRLSYTAS